MLQMQVDYWKLQEAKRNNAALENLRGQELAQKQRELMETTLSHRNSEALTSQDLAEKKRNNLRTSELRAQEIRNTAERNANDAAIGWQNLNELRRTHQANESISQAAQRETALHNAWNRSETTVKNQRDYNISRSRANTQNYADMKNAESRSREADSKAKDASTNRAKAIGGIITDSVKAVGGIVGPIIKVAAARAVG